ncbi:uncharacterized protein K02A2.6-like [Ornithodoros turicata]|uniref:uncharacterized protein K02A2.6-like n=1 Tax=Ornithodoros turicata TaxID=34597 RepID=UPI003138CF01
MQEASRVDPSITAVVKFIEDNSWPCANLPTSLLPFYRCRDELSSVDGLLLRGDRIVVPQAVTDRLLASAHDTHCGIVRTKQRLREYYWWPGMDSHVEKMVRSCSVCQACDKSAKTAQQPLHPVPFPKAPWSKLGLDIVGPFEQNPQPYPYALTLVDYHSKWPEVSFSSTVTARTVTTFLQHLFSREGYPEEVVTDNGPQFLAVEFQDFLRSCGIRHTLVSIYYPQANGQVERFNRVLKDIVQIAANENKPLRTTVLEYLTVYRSTPHATTGVSPSLLLHGRNLRTKLQPTGIPIITPKLDMPAIRRRVAARQTKQKTNEDNKGRAVKKRFHPGDYVRVRLPGRQTKGNSKYSAPLRIVAPRGPLSYLLEDGRVWHSSKFARAQPREPPAGDKVDTSSRHGWWTVSIPKTESAPVEQPQDALEAPPPPPPPLRRSARSRAPPVRYPNSIPGT